MAGETLSLALEYHRAPLRFQWLTDPARALPGDIGEFLEMAVSEVREAELQELAEGLGSSPAEMRQAAIFFVRQVFFAPSANHYRVLGLERDAAPEAIRKHYRLLIRLFHPDRASQDCEWQEAYATRINDAYNTLRSSDKRQAYDGQLATAQGQGAKLGAANKTGASRSVRANRVSTGSPSEIPYRTRLWHTHPRLMLWSVLIAVLSGGLAIFASTQRSPVLVDIDRRMATEESVAGSLDSDAAETFADADKGGKEHEVDVKADIKALNAVLAAAPTKITRVEDARQRRDLDSYERGKKVGITRAEAELLVSPPDLRIPTRPRSERETFKRSMRHSLEEMVGEEQRGVSSSSLGKVSQKPVGGLPLPLGEGRGEGAKPANALIVNKTPHPNLLPEGEGTRSLLSVATPSPAEKVAMRETKQEPSDGPPDPLTQALSPREREELTEAASPSDSEVLSGSPIDEIDPKAHSPNMQRWQVSSDEQAHSELPTLGSPEKLSDEDREAIARHELDLLLANFVVAYETGDSEAMMELFTRQALADGLQGHARIRADYADLFSRTVRRRLVLRDIEWQHMPGYWRGKGGIEVQTESGSWGGSARAQGSINLYVVENGDQFLIAELNHRIDD